MEKLVVFTRETLDELEKVGELGAEIKMNGAGMMALARMVRGLLDQRDELAELLRESSHTLSFITGLYATDRPELFADFRGSAVVWQIDETVQRKKIDAALEVVSS